MFATPTRFLLVISGTDVMTVLPHAMRAIRKGGRLCGESHRYRERDTSY
jgi:hypothetical protein